MKKRVLLIELIFVVLFVISATLFGFSLGYRIDNLLAVSLAVMLILMIFSIVKSLIKKERNNWLDWIEVSLSIALAICIVIAFASASPLEIKDAVIQISSAVIGGSLTLYGVGLTIKYARIEKEEDEIKKAKPVVFPISDVTWNSTPKDKRNDIFVEINKDSSEIKPSNSKNSYSLFTLLIANSDASLCGLYGVAINKKIIRFEYEQILSKNSSNQILFESSSKGYQFNIKEKINSVSLLLVDMLGNIYECVSRFEINNYREIKINAFLEIKLFK